MAAVNAAITKYNNAPTNINNAETSRMLCQLGKYSTNISVKDAVETPVTLAD